MHTLRLRSAAWFATGVVLTLIAALTITQAWSVDAAPGDDESVVVPVNPPVRVLDTRDANEVGLAGPFVSPTAQKLKVTGSIPTSTGPKIVLPDGATGVLLNVTAVRPTSDGFISVRPGDATGTPATSNLNVKAGDNIPNAVTVALPTTGTNAGQIDITYVSGNVAGPSTEILVDVVGYLTTSVALSDVKTRVDTLESAPKTYRFDAMGVATSAVDYDTARTTAPVLPLGTVGDFTFTAKCLHDATTDTVRGEIYAATSVDGAIMEGTDDLPASSGTAYLLTTTPEVERRTDTQSTSNPMESSIGESEGFMIQADGTSMFILSHMFSRGSGHPAGDGPLPAGNSCAMGITVFS